MNKEKRDRLYAILCTCLTIVFIGVMLFMATDLPHLGLATNPDINEVPEFYVEEGPEETGALNAVTAMILHYRAFDTLGESCVLFVAAISVFILLRIDGNASNDTIVAIDRRYEPVNDPILSKTFLILVPAVFIAQHPVGVAVFPKDLGYAIGAVEGSAERAAEGVVVHQTVANTMEHARWSWRSGIAQISHLAINSTRIGYHGGGTESSG